MTARSSASVSIGPLTMQVTGPASFETFLSKYACDAPADTDEAIHVELSPSEAPYSGPLAAPPAFHMQSQGDALLLGRGDAFGTISLSDRWPTARFDVRPIPGSIDASLRLCAAAGLIYRGGALLHASAVVHKGRALIFTGQSGAGKSTISKYLAEHAGLSVLSDELLAVAVEDGRLMAHSTPFVNRSPAHPESYPVDAIHFLVQSDETEVSPMEGNAAVGRLLENVLIYAGHPRLAQQLLATALSICAATTTRELRFAIDDRIQSVLGVSAT